MKKSTKLISVLTLFLLSFCPTDSLAAIACYGPDGKFTAGCNQNSAPTQICEGVGLKFSLVSGDLVYCMDKNCIQGSRQYCRKCVDGYGVDVILDTSYCFVCPSGCKSCQSRYGVRTCQSCQSGYYLEDTVCTSCPPNATCEGEISPPICNDGYFKDGSKCRACDPSCKTCSGTRNTQCTSCYAGYSNVDGACVKDEAEPTKTNTVNSCPSRMTLSSDGCCCINK